MSMDTCNISCQMKTNAEIEASKWNIPPLKKTYVRPKFKKI